MSALSETTATSKDFFGIDPIIVKTLLDAGEKAFWKQFDAHASLVLFDKKFLLWHIKITLGSLRPQIQALFDLMEPKPITV